MLPMPVDKSTILVNIWLMPRSNLFCDMCVHHGYIPAHYFTFSTKREPLIICRAIIVLMAYN